MLNSAIISIENKDKLTNLKRTHGMRLNKEITKQLAKSSRKLTTGKTVWTKQEKEVPNF